MWIKKQLHTRHYYERLLSFYLFVVIFSLGTDVFAQGTSGLHNPLFGAAALAQGNAFVARADDATAVHFNPAGLIQLTKPEISLGATFVLPIIKYDGPHGDETMRRKINTIPNLYFTSPIVENRLAAGLGITTPFGLSGKWSSTGFSRYVITEFDLKIIDINPSFAFKPFSFVSIGAGLDVFLLKSKRKKLVNVGVTNSVLTGLPVDPGTPDGFQKLDEQGHAVGYNIGLLFDITPRHSVGISFRSRAKTHIRGKFKFHDLSGATASVFGGSAAMVRSRTSAELPEMVSFGHAYKRDSWSVEADMQWTNWERFDVLKYGFRPSNVLLEADDKDVRDWHNTWSFALGGEYRVNEALKVRGGYAYHESPVPSRTFEPSVPQSSRHGLFAGFGYRRGNKWVDFAYGAIFYEDRHINNTVGDSKGGPIDGGYDSMTHMVGINFNFNF